MVAPTAYEILDTREMLHFGRRVVADMVDGERKEVILMRL